MQLEYTPIFDGLVLFFKEDMDILITKKLSHGVLFNFDFDYNLVSIEIPNLTQTLGLRLEDFSEFKIINLDIDDDKKMTLTFLPSMANMSFRSYTIKIDCSQL